MAHIKNQFVFYAPDYTSRMILEGEPAFQISRVLRLSPGEPILLLDGNGKRGLFCLDRVDSSQCSASLISEERFEKPAPLALGLGILKNDKLEWVIQKGTELGVTEFRIFQGENSVVRIKDGGEKKIQRWERIAVEALEQSMGSFIPSIQVFSSLNQVFQESGNLFWLAAQGESSARLDQFQIQAERGCGILIGPEGGFSQDEIRLLQEKEIPSFQITSTILRAETAALSAISQAVLFRKK